MNGKDKEIRISLQTLDADCVTPSWNQCIDTINDFNIFIWQRNWIDCFAKCQWVGQFQQRKVVVSDAGIVFLVAINVLHLDDFATACVTRWANTNGVGSGAEIENRKSFFVNSIFFEWKPQRILLASTVRRSQNPFLANDNAATVMWRSDLQRHLPRLFLDGRLKTANN